MCAPYAHPENNFHTHPPSLLPFPPLSPACLPSLYRFLTSFSGFSSSAISPRGPSLRTLEPFLRLSDPRFILVKREHAAKRRGRVGGQEKKGRIYPLPSRRDHLSFWCRAVSDSLIARPCVWSTLLGSCGERNVENECGAEVILSERYIAWTYLECQVRDEYRLAELR